MIVHLSVRQMLKRDFGVDLPISGGIGNSINNPVIIEPQAGTDYRQVENDYLKYVCMGRKVIWEFIGRDPVGRGDRRMDKVRIGTQEFTPEEVITQVEHYYFDITDCVVPPMRRKKTHRDFPDLINELNARDVVFRMDFNTRELRSKARWNAPFGNGDFEAEDTALWQQLFDGQISEEAALDAMTTLMERYYGKPYSASRKWIKK